MNPALAFIGLPDGQVGRLRRRQGMPQTGRIEIPKEPHLTGASWVPLGLVFVVASIGTSGAWVAATRLAEMKNDAVTSRADMIREVSDLNQKITDLRTELRTTDRVTGRDFDLWLVQFRYANPSINTPDRPSR